MIITTLKSFLYTAMWRKDQVDMADNLFLNKMVIGCLEQYDYLLLLAQYYDRVYDSMQCTLISFSIAFFLSMICFKGEIGELAYLGNIRNK